MVGLVGLLGLFCRTPTKDRFDPRLLGEFSLVVLTMLFASERSWKHHYVTLLLPYTYLAYRVFMPDWGDRRRWVLAGSLILSALMMVATSTEVGGLFHDGQGHELAQAYGLFCWSGMVLYVATAACLVGERDREWVPIQDVRPLVDRAHVGPPSPHLRPGPSVLAGPRQLGEALDV